MNEEREPLEVDARVRAALAPDEEAMRRIVARALAADNAAPRRNRRTVVFAGAIAALLVVAAAAWLSRPRTAPPPREFSLAVSVQGRLLVVEREDGRRWIVGPTSPHRAGGYLIVVQRDKE